MTKKEKKELEDSLELLKNWELIEIVLDQAKQLEKNEYSWSNKNYSYIKQALQNARFFNWYTSQGMQDGRQA